MSLMITFLVVGQGVSVQGFAIVHSYNAEFLDPSLKFTPRPLGATEYLRLIGLVGLGPDSCGWKSRAQSLLVVRTALDREEIPLLCKVAPAGRPLACVYVDELGFIVRIPIQLRGSTRLQRRSNLERRKREDEQSGKVGDSFVGGLSVFRDLLAISIGQSCEEGVYTVLTATSFSEGHVQGQ
ncbi:hypothetical protein M434DRAFT_30207 [Hypoxylon sp. CO27-5]|nr:hypothetical protein M434DRAFT_30207 [Hypoxylon sp. CO27-5]